MLKIPNKFISSICPNIPTAYLERFLILISEKIEKTINFELNINWLTCLLFNFSDLFKENNMKLLALFKNISKSIQTRFLNITNMYVYFFFANLLIFYYFRANENIYFMEFILGNLNLQNTPETQMEFSD